MEANVVEFGGKQYKLVPQVDGEIGCEGCAFHGIETRCNNDKTNACMELYTHVWKEQEAPASDPEIISTFTHSGVQFDLMVAQLIKPGADILSTMTPEKMDLLHVAVGVAGEAGELLDAVKKYVVYNKPLDVENMTEELGDLSFYMERIYQIIGVTREQTLQATIEKLVTGEKARYKDGYSDMAAQQRADKQ